MNRRWYFLLTLSLSICGTACTPTDSEQPRRDGGGSPQTYAIKQKETGKGETVQVERSFSETNETQIEGAKGAQKQVDKKVQRFAFRETVQERPADEPFPTRLQRAYDKAEVSVNGKEQTLGIQGKTVVVEKKDGKYRFQLADGKEFSEEAAKVLAEEFTRQSSPEVKQMFVPAKAVPLKDPWQLDLSPLIKEVSKSLTVDKDKAMGTGKLLRVHKDKEGRLFGEMEYQIDLPIKELITAKGDKVPLQPGSKWSLTLNRDACIDGSVESGTQKSEESFAGTALLRGQDGTRLKMTFDSKTMREETRKEVPAK
jgi:hypothetical protein